KLQTSGHLYFNLKDAGAQISAVLFKGSASKLLRLPKEGDQVLALGELSLYAPRGNYQLVIRELQFLGVGELLLKLHQRKQALEAKGWFDPGHKKPLPRLPKRIGVVTSPTGAVIQDIIQVLARRFKGFHVILNPVKVQGDGAAEEIAAAIDDFNKHALADVLIVGRGGGSIEDLWAFNEEIVVKAIFDSKIPIISAVGHETDTTLADWVADVRAPTPSAAAEMAIAEKTALCKFLAQATSFMEQKVRGQSKMLGQKLQALQRHPLLFSPQNLLSKPMQQLDDLQETLLSTFRNALAQKNSRLAAMTKNLALLEPSKRLTERKKELRGFNDRLLSLMQQNLRHKRDRLERLTQHFRSIHPNHLLKQGYAILFAENSDSIILSAKELSPKQTLCALLHDGKIRATIDGVTPNDPRNTLF
ncbi:MAG TPA: exodeoxyribonuclease VII large subunit, partial [Chlamydiales bacterium]